MPTPSTRHRSLQVYWRLTALMLLAVLILAPAGPVPAQSGTFRNPLNALGGADPWLTYYDGNYYLAATTWTSELTMRRSPTLAGLKTAPPQRIYFETDPSRCCNMWAPEFRLLDGPNGPRWYFYYTAGTAGTYDNQHTHVLESTGTDPLGPYTYKARLFDPANDGWAIDGSVLELDGALYFLFSSWVGPDQSLFIAPMSNPWTISGPRVLISTPTYPWERIGGNVNEGPVALQHDGDTFIIYSASSCNTADYQLGMLTYSGGDPLSPDSWVKNPTPVFARSDENGVFGPGHNGFFTSPDGTETWIVYHANDSPEGGCNGRRTTRAQPITWNADGTPNLGVPVSVETAIPNPSGDDGEDPLPAMLPPDVTRYRNYAYNERYIRHTSFQAWIDRNVTPRADSEFLVVPGLANPEAVSIQASNFPGFYLLRRSNGVFLAADDGSATFAADATWWLRPGLADASGVSFESYSLTGQYIGLRRPSFFLRVGEVTTDDQRAQATFLVEH